MTFFLKNYNQILCLVAGDSETAFSDSSPRHRIIWTVAEVCQTVDVNPGYWTFSCYGTRLPFNLVGSNVFLVLGNCYAESS